MTNSELKDFLDEQVERFNGPEFIPSDPISIPHLFQKKQDIEISGLIAAVFSWGQRRTIIAKATEFLNRMDDDPFNFVLNHSENDLKRFTSLVHRTFQPTDALYFIQFFSEYYKKNDSMEHLFLPGQPIELGLKNFHNQFFSLPFSPHRTKKHIPTPERKSSCKRINMFLRWMVRRDNKGVDFGIWQQLKPNDLICPIDVHVGNVSRELGLLTRKQNDWQAAKELTKRLSEMDKEDPVKYDFALFGLGANRRIS